ncbi:MAG: hypothetical protein GYB68_17785 [Chloroflexi bacterium]|nr:hypothetical protein [Chloroflexota bacterium]
MVGNRLPVIILGAGGYAEVLVEILKPRADVEPIGFTDKAYGLSERSAEDAVTLPVLGNDDDLAELAEEYLGLHAVLALGPQLMDIRSRLIERLVRLDLPALSVVHPSAFVSTQSVLSAGTVVREGGLLSVGVQTGAHCVINVAASLDHHAVLEQNVFVGHGARIASYAHIERDVIIEMGAKVNSRVRVGHGARITAGSFVNTDVPEYAVVSGIPARIIRYAED